VERTVVRVVVVAESAAEKDKNMGEMLIFCQIFTRFSSCSEHEIYSYL
jgi:hypothetical protein